VRDGDPAEGQGRRSNSDSLAKFAAMRRASFLMSSFVAERRHVRSLTSLGRNTPSHLEGACRRSSSGSLAKFAALRRASPLARG